MNHATQTKIVPITVPGAIVDNAAFTTTAIDTAGFRYCTIYVLFGAMDIAMAALKVQESDASNMSGAVDVSGADFSVSPATLPSATADNKLYAIDVNLDGRLRYLDLSATGGDGTTGTYMVAWAVLSKAAIEPSTAALRGIDGALLAV